VIAVEAEDGQAGRGVFGRAELFIGVSGDAMLRTEEGHDLHAGSVGEDVDRGALLIVEPGVIGNQADVFAVEGSELLHFQDVEACLHAPYAASPLYRLGVGLGRDRRARCENQN